MKSVRDLLDDIFCKAIFLEQKIEGLRDKASWNEGKTTRISYQLCQQLLENVSLIKEQIKQIESMLGLRRVEVEG